VIVMGGAMLLVGLLRSEPAGDPAARGAEPRAATVQQHG